MKPIKYYIFIFILIISSCRSDEQIQKEYNLRIKQEQEYKKLHPKIVIDKKETLTDNGIFGKHKDYIIIYNNKTAEYVLERTYLLTNIGDTIK